MSTPIKILLAAWVLVLGACTKSDKMTPEEAMAESLSNIPEDARIFSGYMETMDEFKNMDANVQKLAQQRRRILEQAEAQAVQAGK